MQLAGARLISRRLQVQLAAAMLSSRTEQYMLPSVSELASAEPPHITEPF